MEFAWDWLFALLVGWLEGVGEDGEDGEEGCGMGMVMVMVMVMSVVVFASASGDICFFDGVE